MNRKQRDFRAVVNIKPPLAKDMLRSNVPSARRRTEEERPGLRNSRSRGCLMGGGKGRGRDSKSANAGQSPEPSCNERRCFNEVVKDLPLVFLNPTVVAAQNNRMAATGCLTIESAGGIELEWKLICMPSSYEHWRDAFDGPHDTGTTGSNRLALRNRESAGVERAGTQKRRARIGLRDQLDPGAQHVASLFAGTEEQIRTVADRDVPNLGQAPSTLSPDRVGLYKPPRGLRQGEDHREGSDNPGGLVLVAVTSASNFFVTELGSEEALRASEMAMLRENLIAALVEIRRSRLGRAGVESEVIQSLRIECHGTVAVCFGSRTRSNCV